MAYDTFAVVDHLKPQGDSAAVVALEPANDNLGARFFAFADEFLRRHAAGRGRQPQRRERNRQE
jgi:hypothetical protein